MVDFSEFADVHDTTHEKTFDLEVLSSKIKSGPIFYYSPFFLNFTLDHQPNTHQIVARLHVTIGAKFISQGNQEEDDMSMMSAASFQPEDNRALQSDDSDHSDVYLSF